MSTLITPGTSWQQISVTFTADSTNALRVHLYYSAGSGTIYYDDVLVQPTSTNGSGTTHLFTGDERDTQTNLDHTWFRKYSSAQGRWMTPDPAGLAAVDPTNPQSWNRYAYVLNDPLDFADPLGLDPPCGDGFNPHVVDVTRSSGTWYYDYMWLGGIVGLGQLGEIAAGGNGNGKCHDPQRTGGNGAGSGGGSNTQIVNGDGQSCTPSVFDPSCKPPSCPTVFINSSNDAIDFIPALPSGFAPEDAAKAATAAAVTRHIVNRGLVVPLRSSIVRKLLFWGETAADAVLIGPALYQAAVGFKHETTAWWNHKCTTIWSTSRVP